MNRAEAKIYRRLIEWAAQPEIRKQYPQLKWLYKVNNENAPNPMWGKQNQLEGVKKGVSDYCLPYPVGKYGALYVEVKPDGGKPTKEQIEFIDDMNAAGNKAVFAYGFEETIKIIKEYLDETL